MSLGDAQWEFLLVLAVCGLFAFTFFIIWLSVKHYLENQDVDNVEE